MIKIAITDDHPLLLEGLKNILNTRKSVKVTECYSSAKELLEGLPNAEIDVLLLDINLEDANSIEILSKITKIKPELYIIMLSVHNELAVINSCISQGAFGYIQKNASIDEILIGIETVYKGEKFFCTQTQKKMKIKENDQPNTVPKLTRREKEILIEAAFGLTTNQIAEKLFISPHTVESHRKNLIEKFQTSNLSSAIKLAFEYGLIGV
ncbi:response regulator transcription factor [Flavobacterium sp. I3-2]|uniref:response regulator transcription factor n=1 Tax=Flavobacterium sp. I3-2 TaxID=2748319 RepID=UPI0015B07079|nr:response regulator transcription factor [Flavobacterium sp. I3-2]